MKLIHSAAVQAPAAAESRCQSAFDDRLLKTTETERLPDRANTRRGDFIVHAL